MALESCRKAMICHGIVHVEVKGRKAVREARRLGRKRFIYLREMSSEVRGRTALSSGLAASLKTIRSESSKRGVGTMHIGTHKRRGRV
jgi:hypothetical protein